KLDTFDHFWNLQRRLFTSRCSSYAPLVYDVMLDYTSDASEALVFQYRCCRQQRQLDEQRSGFNDDLMVDNWRPPPEAPHNTGTAVDADSTNARCYRVISTPAF
ncbi:MAG: hypothetical protein ACI9TH_004220, partial [Kiritimatiellia bacterium]